MHLPKAEFGILTRDAIPNLTEALQEFSPVIKSDRTASLAPFWRSLQILLQLEISSLNPIDDHVGDQSQCSHSYEKFSIACPPVPSSSCPSFPHTASNHSSFTTHTYLQTILSYVSFAIWCPATTSSSRIRP